MTHLGVASSRAHPFLGLGPSLSLACADHTLMTTGLAVPPWGVKSHQGLQRSCRVRRLHSEFEVPKIASNPQNHGGRKRKPTRVISPCLEFALERKECASPTQRGKEVVRQRARVPKCVGGTPPPEKLLGTDRDAGACGRGWLGRSGPGAWRGQACFPEEGAG